MKQINLTPEQNLCILFARLNLTSLELERIKDFCSSYINWDIFFSLSNHHRISALIYSHLINHKLEAFIPLKVLELFQNTYFNHQTRNTLLFSDLKSIFKIFHSSSIKVILLKGASLVPRIYKNIAIRPMGDCDFLIERESLKLTEKILNKYEYYREKSLEVIMKRSVHPWERLKELKESGHLAFYKIMDLPYKKYLCLEAHINIFRRSNRNFTDQTSDYLKRVEFFSFYDEIPVYCLNPSDEFVYLCTHLFYNFTDIYSVYKNTDSRLIRLCDLREFLLAHPDLKIEFTLLPESQKKSVLFSLNALKMVYNENYFPELLKLDFSENEYKNIYWKENSSEVSMAVDQTFLSRLFRMNSIDAVDSIYPEIEKKQMNEYFYKIDQYSKMTTGKAFVSCKQ